MTTAQLLALIDQLYPNAESAQSKVQYMNLAQNELSPYFGVTVENSSLTTTADDDSYAFPTGLEDVSQILTIDIGNEATPQTRHSYNKYFQGNRDEIPVGSNVFFQLIDSTGAKSLGLYPIPGTTGLPIRIRFNKKLTDLSVTAQTLSPDFDSRYHVLLAYYAVAMICGSGASPDAVQHDYYMRKWDDGLSELWKLRMNQGRIHKNKRRCNIQWRNG